MHLAIGLFRLKTNLCNDETNVMTVLSTRTNRFGTIAAPTFCIEISLPGKNKNASILMHKDDERLIFDCLT